MKYNAEVPFLRSKKNARDVSTDYDVVKEFLFRISTLEKIIPQYILYLRPTTPMRLNKTINRACTANRKLFISIH